MHFSSLKQVKNIYILLTATQNIGHLSLLVEVLTNFVVTALIGLSNRHPGGKTYSGNKSMQQSLTKKITDIINCNTLQDKGAT